MANFKKAERVTPTNFLDQTYKMVDDDDTNNVVSWTEGGACFMVKDVKEFTRVLLPKYFRHEKFSNFTRQLNIYVSFEFDSRSYIYLFIDNS